MGLEDTFGTLFMGLKQTEREALERHEDFILACVPYVLAGRDSRNIKEARTILKDVAETLSAYRNVPDYEMLVSEREAATNEQAIDFWMALGDTGDNHLAYATDPEQRLDKNRVEKTRRDIRKAYTEFERNDLLHSFYKNVLQNIFEINPDGAFEQRITSQNHINA